MSGLLKLNVDSRTYSLIYVRRPMIYNKVNGWIGFWIVILAIFGGVIPIVIQYVQTWKTKLAIEGMLEDISFKISSTKFSYLSSRSG